MPATDPYGQGFQYSVLSDAPNGQTIGQEIVTQMTDQTVMRFPSASARAGILTGAQAPAHGMVTYLAAEDRFEGYLAGQGWAPLTPGPWEPITLASGRVAAWSVPQWRVNGGLIELQGSVAKSDNSTFYWNGATNESTGLANDWQLGTLPSAARPATADRYAIVPTEMATNYYARVQIRAANASSGPGQIHLNVPHIAGQSSTVDTSSGPHWVSLDGIKFPIS